MTATPALMRIEFLVDVPEAMPVIGGWYCEEWGRRLRGESPEESTGRLAEYLNRDRIPFALVAMERQAILGAAQLKYREMADVFPELEHWLGGVFVAPEHRGRGVGTLLTQEITRLAPSYGVSTLHLQTERLDGGLYRRLGWRSVGHVQHHGLEVLVMERFVGDPATHSPSKRDS